MMSVTFWLRYRNMAVITVLDHDYQTFKITKPSLIICPMDNIDEAKINDTFKRYGVKDTRETREFFRFLSTATYENMAEAPEYEDVAPEKWLLILHDLQKPISTEKEIINVDKTIKPIVTERGICLMKDSYVSVYSSLDYWMANNWTTVEIPQILNYYTYETRNEIVDFKLSYNFTISLSDPRDIMDYNRVFYEIRNLQTINMKYEIFEVFSSEKVKALSVYQRKCKFMSNGGLRMWPEYRYSMCVTECRYTKIKQLCGCYPHFARPIDDTPVCGTKQFQCIGKYVAEIVSLSKEVLRGCNCILDCDIVSYEPEDINVVVWREGGLIKGLVSRVAIDFPRDKYFRKVLYGLYDFLGSVGGAAGLLLGASVLSFIEIIYFLTFRLCNQEYVTTKLNRKQRMSKMKGYNKKVNMWEMEKNEEILYVNKKD
ncbi:sodium channel protein Nach-like isoform X2 [Prorops nasuta]|uniref:sodium channel protein Nach-like isoform X2 n=1 Tax=Prorops nasuta TaxID=863751 RepID=UPI0034CEBD2A